MHPFLSDRQHLLYYLSGWLASGAALTGYLRWGGWVNAAAFALPLCPVFGFTALSAYYVCQALPYSQRAPSRVAGLFGMASLLSGGMWWALAQIWGLALQSLVPGWPPGFPGAVASFPVFLCGVVLYLFSLLIHDAWIASDNARQENERMQAMRALAREAELQMLRTQINPHFLFNSLNSISALTAIDPAGARAMTIDLAEFFRYSLPASSRGTTTLGEELGLCERFLAIEKRRFGNRLGIEWRIDEAARTCIMPPMCLQPLLENAIKHGIGGLAQGGVIRIEALVQGGWLRVTVSNPVASGSATLPEGAGVGLKNLRERLALHYDTRASLNARRDGQTFLVEITVPRHEETAQ
ncbi:sensor histidine kinase [Paludibacterium paludis]|uniref:Signal transduction histidine kinase internal region domain-containing protein n=1 Tax=Paludibacterium paludis TaxID=1225769 RepID=A0A918NYU7_9NEIS|nr:sensor histidine kinase [Paludibacterium paludis]GGY07822.1 hypothetical protein GCM10011289_07960 [Paludibacterium paludis]